MSQNQQPVKKHQEFILAIQANPLVSYFETLHQRYKIEDKKEILGFDFEEFAEQIEDHLFIARRAGLEKNSQFRQILPYTVFRKGNKLVTYRRAKGLGEERLLGNFSVGFGGHIEIDDVMPKGIPVEGTNGFEAVPGSIDLFLTIQQSKCREIREELSSQSDEMSDETISHLLFDSVPQFILIDNDKDVGIYHFALVTVFDIDESVTFKSNEENEGIEMIGDMDMQEILDTGKAEPWTKLVLEMLLSK